MSVKRRSKYGAVPTVVDGIRFASKKEARRYGELKLLQKAGHIGDLKIQPTFYLHAPDKYQERQPVVGRYVADFSYMEVLPNSHRLVVEDVKSAATRNLAMYRWKVRHMKAEYNITITEI